MYVQNQREFNRVVGLYKHACAHCNNAISSPPVIVDKNQRYYHAGCAMQLARDILDAFGELYEMRQKISAEPHIPLAEILHQPSREKSQNLANPPRTGKA